MKKTVTYRCRECDAEFPNEKECKKHEALHNVCVCKGGYKDYNAERYIWAFDYHNTYEILLDLRRKRLTDKLNQKQLIIRYCPFCGNKLRKRWSNEQ